MQDTQTLSSLREPEDGGHAKKLTVGPYSLHARIMPDMKK